MAAKQKVVLLLGLHENDAREKRKVLKAVSTFPGLDLIAVDMKQSKLRVVGLVDPIELVTKLRKLWHADILFVRPAKEDKAVAGDKNEGGAGGVMEEGDRETRHEVTAKQVERPADMRSWPHAAVYIYPPRPRHPYPCHPHHQYVAHGHDAQENPHNSYVPYGHGAQENHHPNSYFVAGGLGAQENPPYYYIAHGHGARENPPNACAIC